MLSITPIKNLLFQKKACNVLYFFYINIKKKYTPVFHIVLYEVKMTHIKSSTMTIVQVHNVV